MSTAPHVTIASRPADWDAGRHLLTDYLDWVAAEVGTAVPDEVWALARAERDDLPGRFRPPGRFHVAWLGRVPVGILGARRDAGASIAEAGRGRVTEHLVRDCRFVANP